MTFDLSQRPVRNVKTGNQAFQIAAPCCRMHRWHARMEWKDWGWAENKRGTGAPLPQSSPWAEGTDQSGKFPHLPIADKFAAVIHPIDPSQPFLSPRSDCDSAVSSRTKASTIRWNPGSNSGRKAANLSHPSDPSCLSSPSERNFQTTRHSLQIPCPRPCVTDRDLSLEGRLTSSLFSPVPSCRR